MARLTVELPEEFGTEVDEPRPPEEAELHVGRRSHGRGEEPQICRWFATWAEGAPDLG